MTPSRITIAAALALLLLVPTAAPAQDRGAVTGLPIPRFVSIKGAEANARRGPGLDHRIDWVFVHRAMPVRVTDEYGHWRRVQDVEGEGGWVHYSLLSGAATAVVTVENLPIYFERRSDGKPMAIAERGVIVTVNACDATWCDIEVGAARGWAAREGLWGALGG